MKTYFLFSVIAAVWAGGAGAPLADAQVKVGDAFPPLAAADLSGATLPDLAGKVVMVDFCASWCAPCKASFPTYSKLQTEYGPKGFVIVAVSIDQSTEDYAKFVKRLHPSFVVLNDPQQKLVGTVQVPAMPSSYLLDRSGHVVAIHSGFHSGSTEKELRADIERTLARTPPS